jgi:O-antigen/teichoic acid export membrane protein
MIREVLGRYLQTEQRSLAFASFSFAKVFCELALQIVFIALLGRGLEGAFEAVLIAEASFATLYSLWLLPKLGLRFSRSIFAGLFAFALPLMPNGVLQFCLHSADRYFVEALASREDVGIYALAYKLGYIGNYALLGPFLMVWFPYVFSLGALDKQKRIVGELGPYFLCVLTALSLAIALFAAELVDALANRPGFRAAASAVPWVALGYWFWGWFQLAQTGFYVVKDTRSLPWLTGAAALFNALANLALIPRFGFLGAAIATAATFALLALATQVRVRGVFEHRVQWSRILAPLAAAGVAYAAARIAAPRVDAPAWIVKAIAFALWLAWAWFGGFASASDRSALCEMLREIKRG